MTFTFKSCLREGLIWCTAAGIALAAGAAVHEAAAQDRIDTVTESAAEIQQTESFGQPDERTSPQYGPAYYEQGYDRAPYDQGRAFNQSQFGQQPYRRQEASYRGEQQRPEGASGGLGVVLREGGGRGVQIVDVHRGSPAEEAGLEAGDRVIAIDGRNVRSVRELQSRVMQHDPGEQVEVVAIRDGREQMFGARLESRSEALNRRRGQQAEYQRQSYAGDQFTEQRGRQPRWQGDGWAQDRQVRARLASLERQLQQLLRDVQTLQTVVEAQRENVPAPPRQAQRQGQPFQFQQEREGQQQERQMDNRSDYYEDEYYPRGPDSRSRRSYEF